MSDDRAWVATESPLTRFWMLAPLVMKQVNRSSLTWMLLMVAAVRLLSWLRLQLPVESASSRPLRPPLPVISPSLVSAIFRPGSVARQLVPLTGEVLDSTAPGWPLHWPLLPLTLASVGSMPLIMFHCSENELVSVRGRSMVPKLPWLEASQ